MSQPPNHFHGPLLGPQKVRIHWQSSIIDGLIFPPGVISWFTCKSQSEHWHRKWSLKGLFTMASSDWRCQTIWYAYKSQNSVTELPTTKSFLDNFLNKFQIQQNRVRCLLRNLYYKSWLILPPKKMFKRYFE